MVMIIIFLALACAILPSNNPAGCLKMLQEPHSYFPQESYQNSGLSSVAMNETIFARSFLSITEIKWIKV